MLLKVVVCQMMMMIRTVQDFTKVISHQLRRKCLYGWTYRNNNITCSEQEMILCCSLNRSETQLTDFIISGRYLFLLGFVFVRYTKQLKHREACIVQ